MKQFLTFFMLACAFLGLKAKTNHYVFTALLGDSPIKMQLSVDNEKVSATYTELATQKIVTLGGTFHADFYELEEYGENKQLVGIWKVEMFDKGCVWGNRINETDKTETAISGFLSDFSSTGISGIYQGAENYQAIMVERDPSAFQVFLHVGGEDVGEIETIAFWTDDTHTAAFAEIPQDISPDLPCFLEFFINKNSIEIKESNPCHEFRGVGTSFEGKLWKKDLRVNDKL